MTFQLPTDEELRRKQEADWEAMMRFRDQAEAELPPGCVRSREELEEIRWMLHPYGGITRDWVTK